MTFILNYGNIIIEKERRNEIDKKDVRDLKIEIAEFLFYIYEYYCNERGCEIIQILRTLKQEIEQEYNKAIDDLFVEYPELYNR